MPAKVLIPVDGARNSKAAEEYAVKLNKLMPLSAVLFNVINTKELDGHGIDAGYKETIIETKRKFSEKAVAEAANILKTGGIEYERMITSGDPASLICYTAKSENCDMILITESGMSEFKDWVMGSVANYVLHRSPVPVLLVKHPRES